MKVFDRSGRSYFKGFSKSEVYSKKSISRFGILIKKDLEKGPSLYLRLDIEKSATKINRTCQRFLSAPCSKALKCVALLLESRIASWFVSK
jgi:hypothetical protein